MKPTSGATHDARYEATAGPTPMPTFPATTATQASGDHGRSPTRVAPRILVGTIFGPSVRAISTTLPTVLIALTPQKSCAYDLYAGHYTASGRRGRMGPAGPATKGGVNLHVPPQDDEP